MYFDTSVIVSLYVEDTFTAKAEAFYVQHAPAATVSAWVDLELKSALSLLVRTERLTLAGAQLAWQTYAEDRARGVYRSVLLAPEHFAAGTEALMFANALRAGDALHLGAAETASLPLVTSDKTLHKVAQACRVSSFYLPDFD